MIRLWTDFGDIYDDHYTWTLLKFAELEPSKEIAVGEWAELWDHEGNRCYGVITEIEDQIVHVRLDWSTWVLATHIPELHVFGLRSKEQPEWTAEPVSEDLLLKA